MTLAGGRTRVRAIMLPVNSYCLLGLKPMVQDASAQLRTDTTGSSSPAMDRVSA